MTRCKAASDDDEQQLLPVDEVPWSSYGRSAYLLTVPQGSRNGRLREILIAYREAVQKRDSYLVVLVDQKSLERPEDVPGFTVLTVTAAMAEEPAYENLITDATFQFWWQGNDKANIWTTRQKVTEWANQVTAMADRPHPAHPAGQGRSRRDHRAPGRRTWHLLDLPHLPAEDQQTARQGHDLPTLPVRRASRYRRGVHHRHPRPGRRNHHTTRNGWRHAPSSRTTPPRYHPGTA